jgi:hypothetical protein
MSDEFLEDLLLATGFDEAIIGRGSRCGQPDVAVYDTEKIINILVKQGMSHEEAVEYFDFNIVGAWMGDQTPIFMQLRYKNED